MIYYYIYQPPPWLSLLEIIIFAKNISFRVDPSTPHTTSGGAHTTSGDVHIGNTAMGTAAPHTLSGGAARVHSSNANLAEAHTPATDSTPSTGHHRGNASTTRMPSKNFSP